MALLKCKLCGATDSLTDIGLVTISGVTYKAFRCDCGEKILIELRGIV